MCVSLGVTRLEHNYLFVLHGTRKNCHFFPDFCHPRVHSVVCLPTILLSSNIPLPSVQRANQEHLLYNFVVTIRLFGAQPYQASLSRSEENMASTADADTATVGPAQIAALTVSIFAIVVFTGISIYLCGERKGCNDCKKATQQALRRLSHIHHHHRNRHSPSRTRMLATQDPSVSSSDQGAREGGRFFIKFKAAFGIKAASDAGGVAAKGTPLSTTSVAAEEVLIQQPMMMRATSPRQPGGGHPGAGNPYSGTEEFQAAVHNLLGYQPGEVQDWYSSSESDDDHSTHRQLQPEHGDGHFPEADHCGADLPAYEEVAQPRRFSWQGHESDYRPEKREE
ncbi:hypothetical protein ISF_01866 [Cordyceps fumosorosea ARSEF 2679]|uniref:Uncharacterized protein n=1 Tax=Cordyceps fumosorosea (strain ARSEF 2679) TaxID=1081104 RepID=A0A168CFK5_CORFA|nr:hypothetical protein ISF_01866 [Cordyceps fumosorosea ARSEF 2679]OAA71315.1 hypothetical protein ISF_01866 [Cordyceps fumosorosea ARSEF 2679]